MLIQIQLIVSLLLIDNNSLPLSNFNLNIMINNSVYNVISDDYGRILFNHNLSVGDYDVNCIFNGDNNYYSTKFSFILKIKKKKKINSVQSILLKSDSFNVCLMDVNNTPLSNRNINVTFHDSTFNLYCNTCETTDNEGFIYVSSPNNGVNIISFSFGVMTII